MVIIRYFCSTRCREIFITIFLSWDEMNHTILTIKIIVIAFTICKFINRNRFNHSTCQGNKDT